MEIVAEREEWREAGRRHSNCQGMLDSCPMPNAQPLPTPSPR